MLRSVYYSLLRQAAERLREKTWWHPTLEEAGAEAKNIFSSCAGGRKEELARAVLASACEKYLTLESLATIERGYETLDVPLGRYT